MSVLPVPTVPTRSAQGGVQLGSEKQGLVPTVPTVPTSLYREIRNKEKSGAWRARESACVLYGKKGGQGRPVGTAVVTTAARSLARKCGGSAIGVTSTTFGNTVIVGAGRATAIKADAHRSEARGIVHVTPAIGHSSKRHCAQVRENTSRSERHADEQAQEDRS